ncbi:MAG: 50S ribosomal protein L3 [Acidobacteriota bacterium]
MKTLLGTKVGMTQILGENGVMIPVTLIKAGPVTVTQVKTVETDGYTAVQVGYGSGKNLSNAVAGHVKKAGVTPKTLKEVRVDDLGELKVGDSFDVSMFAVGDNVDVTGVSKGKGFAGTIKRHNYNRQRKTHGGKGDTRKVGSIGSMYPQKIFKGKTMAGHMGHEQVTVRNLTVAYVDATDGVIGLKGAVPGPRKGLVKIAGEEN